MESYFANFIKTGNPNGKDLPEWPANVSTGVLNYININVTTKAQAADDRPRYLFLQKFDAKK